MDLSLSYKLNTEASGFEFGDEARFDASYQRRIHPRTLGAGVPGFVYAVIESNLIRRGRSTLKGIDDPNSGGLIWYLAPGLQYVRKRLVLEGAVQIPVVQDFNGSALENDFIATISARFNF